MNKITCYDSDGGILKSLTQWDVGQSIVIKGLPTNDAPSVHFCSKGDDKALVVASRFSNTDLVVDVPNILLQKSMPIAAYLYYQQDADSAKTMYTLTINVVPRAKPSDYEYVEDIEYTNWVELTKDAQKLILDMESAYESVSSALQNASSATQNATSAASAANKAASTASAAASSASAASVEASVAADKAELATQAAKIAADRAEGMLFQTVSGELITVSDSAEAPLQGLKVFGKTEQRTTTGKNLLKIIGIGRNELQIGDDSLSYQADGLTGTLKADGTIEISGTVTSTANSYCYFRAQNLALSAGTYSFSGFNGLVFTDGTVFRSTFTLSEQKTFDYGFLEFGTSTATNQVYNLQIERGSTATTYEPYTGGIPSPNPEYPQPLESVGDSGSVTTTVCGKNLLDSTNLIWREALPEYDNIQRLPCKFFPGEYVLTIKTNTGTIRNYVLAATLLDKDNTELKSLHRESNNSLNGSSKFSLTEEEAERAAAISFYYNYGNDNGYVAGEYVSELQIERGSTATAYEPYTATTATVDTPNGLPGIPVKSGGNYTDENGQQWICDEVDFEKGVYVQRVLEQRMTNLILCVASDSTGLSIGYIGSLKDKCISDVGICNALQRKTAGEQWVYNGGCFSVSTKYGPLIQMEGCTTIDELNAYLTENEVIVQFALIEHVEHPLTAEELAQYAALHTNYPNTTVFNDAGAHIEVKYATPTSALPIAGGRMAGPIGMADNRITDVADPVNERDAANRGYVDKGIDAVKNIISDLHHNAIKEASGDIILLSDSAEAPLQGLKIFGKTEQKTTTGKNLFNGILVDGYKESISGELVSANGIYKTMDFHIPADGEYTISFGVGVRIIRRDSVTPNVDCTKITYTLDAGDHYISFRNSESTVWDESVKIQVEKGSTATEWEPYTGGIPAPNPDYPQALDSVGESVKVTACGKNLLKNTAITRTLHDVTFTVNEDGSVKISGTAIANASIKIGDITYEPGKTYIVSGNSGATSTTFALWSGGVGSIYDTDKTFTATEETKTELSLTVFKGANVNTTIRPMIRLAGTDATYEPYTETTAIVSTPNGLPGIPVTSGGNYTDPVTGKQWICDEVDFENGVYVQRCILCEDFKLNSIACENSHSYTHTSEHSLVGLSENKSICTHTNWYLFDTKDITHYYIHDKNINVWLPKNLDIETVQSELKVLAVLTTPISHTLTPEELAQYAAMQSHYPNTAIFNDAGAEMKVKYATPDAVLSMSGGAVANLKVPAPQTAIDAVPKYYVDNVDKKVETLKGIVKSFHSNIVQETSGELITVSDASDLELAGLKVFGKTEQFTTTGKSVLPFVSIRGFNSTLWVNGTVDGQAVVTIDASTSTSGWATIGREFGTIPASGNYVFSAYIYAPTATKCMITIFDSNYTEYGTNGYDLPVGWTRISTHSANLNAGTSYSFAIRAPGPALGADIDVSINRFMVELGTTATEYEPYTGGAPSPSPDYPQALESVGDSKNLLKNTATSNPNMNGVKFTVNTDGSITATGAATANAYLEIDYVPFADVKGKIMNGCKNGSRETFYLYVGYYDASNAWLSEQYVLDGDVVLDSTKNPAFARIRAYVANGCTVSNETFYPMIRLASIADGTYEPYMKRITTAVSGKNLLDESKLLTSSGTGRYTENMDEKIHFVNTDGLGFAPSITLTLPPGTYYFGASIEIISGTPYYGYYINDGPSVWGANRFLTLTEISQVTFRLTTAGTKEAGEYYANFWLTAGDTVTTYEPYTGTTATVTPVDSSGKSLQLPGIPVTSGGNYTDPVTKQQWLCDEVDFAKGVYVQRVGKFIANGTETWTKSDNKFYTTLNQAKRYLSDSGTHILSTRFQDIGSSYLPFTPGTMSMYTANFATYPGENWLYVCASDSHSSSSDIRSYFSANPTEFIFELAEEKHIPLSEIDPDALAQYAALHTNYPNTTIFNDAGAHMELKYVADTKKYVDNKFAELAAALISNT